jgi:serine protease Do
MMKKAIYLLTAAFLGGAMSLGGFGLLFEKPKYFQHPQKVAGAVIPIPTHFINSPSAAAENTDFVLAAEKSLNAVVHVKNTSIRDTRDPLVDFFYGRSNGYSFEQVGTVSGVLISADGHIITNHHVIDEASEIEVTLNNRKVYKATLVGADPNNDIALLKIEGVHFESILFGDSDRVKVGEWVLAVGNPYNLTSTVTAGIVSAKGRDLKGNTNIESFIQTDAAVNPGNSGGALVNARGELIGINTAISSKTGAFVGYSFAVPSNIAKKVVEDLMEYGNVQKALIGIQYDPKEDNLEGVKILAITEGGGAEKAGLQAEDVIVKINEVKITKFSDLKGQLNAKRPGETIVISVLRDARLLTKELKLTKSRTIVLNSLGFSVEKMVFKEGQKKSLPHGVKITNIQNEQLKSLGVKEGSVLLEINGKEINNVDDVEKELSKKARYGFVKLVVLNADGEKENYIFR